MASIAPSRPAARLSIAIALGVLAWILVTGFAVTSFSQQVTWKRIVQMEVSAFAYAFAVAGTITGVAAAVSSGQRRWAIGWCAINVSLVVSSVPIVRWLIFRWTRPTAWSQHLWTSAMECMEIGSALGVAYGLAVSGLVFAVVIMERHMKAWHFGLMVAAITFLLGTWALPAALSRLSYVEVVYAGVNYRYLYDEPSRGAGIGAGTGALAGAIVAGLMARWYCVTGRPGDRGGRTP